VLVVAAYAAPSDPDDCWTPFRSAWVERVLGGDDTAILHTKEAIRRFHEPEWRDRLTVAVEIIKTYTKVRIACVLDLAAHETFRQEWRQRMPKGLQPETAYSFAVTTCLAETARAAQETGYDDWITYIIEQGHPNYGQLRNILDDIMIQPEWRKSIRLWSYMPANKTDYVELQASDVFAYFTREYAEAVEFRRADASNLHPLCRDLLAGTHDYVYWDAERFALYLDDQERAQRDMTRDWWRNKIRSDRRRRREE
jgi:hypothetical protein